MATNIDAAPTHKDTDFNSLPDYSPFVSTLDKASFPEVIWMGEAFDLSEDPYSYLLHQDEVSLAANLHIDCATYLTSKRRIFIACVDCVKNGKEFSKANCQQACNIDVNRASKLWEAFEKVGWFNETHFFRVF